MHLLTSGISPSDDKMWRTSSLQETDSKLILIPFKDTISLQEKDPWCAKKSVYREEGL